MSIKRVIMDYTTYDVICKTCGKIVELNADIGEYPWSWQFMECPRCHHAATPDLEHPRVHEVYGD
jgi:hypothetical protein